MRNHPQAHKPKRHHRLKARSSTFAKWIASTGHSLTEIAERLDCSVQAISNWRGGHSLPGRELANRIAALSNGAVPPDSWDRKARKRKVSA